MQKKYPMIPQGRWFICIVINGDYIVINDDLFFWGAQQKKYPMIPHWVELISDDFVLLLREKRREWMGCWGLLGVSWKLTMKLKWIMNPHSLRETHQEKLETKRKSSAKPQGFHRHDFLQRNWMRAEKLGSNRTAVLARVIPVIITEPAQLVERTIPCKTSCNQLTLINAHNCKI